eukprot:10172787-Heterocapsa_arctica.AAC.1
MGVDNQCFEAQYWMSSSESVQNYQRSARNIMVITIFEFERIAPAAVCESSNGDSEDARRPFEDCSKTVRKPSKTFKAIYT